MTEENNTNIQNLEGGDLYFGTLRQQEEILAQIEKTQPLLSDPIETITLLNQYSKEHKFYKRLQVISKNFPLIRTVRGDGNCFYRSFFYKLFEYLIETRNESEINRVGELLIKLRKELNSFFDPFTMQMFCDEVQSVFDQIKVGFVITPDPEEFDWGFSQNKNEKENEKEINEKENEIKKEKEQTNEKENQIEKKKKKKKKEKEKEKEQEPEPFTKEKLIEIFRDKFRSSSIIAYGRFVTAITLQKNAGLYGSFLTGFTTIDSEVKSNVLPMNKESDTLHIHALTSVFLENYPICIKSLDGNSETGTDVQFPSEAKEDPLFYLFYRPGHYDILLK
ncbi:ubiquitin thioesterase [Anaeramoeba flamelloides]|uniref:Ubiquitin thioesterase n=1 Tax=Anaeramoeba flamelloides TaxID=1746091 RepID=A0ABQ8XNJ5_9EUKA|nr:ubiquitin thioesterase [Anaeramoeba flamelloides]